MWTVVCIAPTKKTAEKMMQILTREGILVKLKPVGDPRQGVRCPVEILVPEAEVDEAIEVIQVLPGK